MITMNNAVVVIYKSHVEAAAAVRELQQSGFDMKKLSIVVRDYHTDEHVGSDANNHIGDRMKYWGKMAALWGGAWGLLFGSAFILTPGVGSLFVGGPVAGWIVGGLEGAAVTGGLTALGAGLYNVRIPADNLRRRKTALNSCRFVEITLSNAKEPARARDIIKYTNEEGFQEHQFSRTNQESSLAGAVIVGTGGLSTVVAGLYSLGVPGGCLPRFETALKSGGFVIIAHGNREEANRTWEIINRTNPEWLHEHWPSRANRKPNLAAA